MDIASLTIDRVREGVLARKFGAEELAAVRGQETVRQEAVAQEAVKSAEKKVAERQPEEVIA